MVLSRKMARLNRVGLNRVTRHIAPWMPGFGIVIHRGRKSGKAYRTPVNVFQRRGLYVFALTYGSDTDWVRNVIAAGGCELETRRRLVRLTEPRLYVDKERKEMPFVVKRILAANDVTEFLDLKVVDEAGSTPPE